jgi:hypothetical protein
MKSYKAFPFLTLLACLSLCSCYHEFTTGGGGGGGGGGNNGSAFVNVTITSTPSTTFSFVALNLHIGAINLITSSGTSTPFLSGALPEGDFVRMQTDSVSLGHATVGATSYTKMQVQFGPPLSSYFYNSTNATLLGCAVGRVCMIPSTVSGFGASTVTVPITFTPTANQNTGIRINFDLSKAVTSAGGMTFDFTQTGAITLSPLPPTASSQTSGLDTIDNFTGMISAKGTNTIDVFSFSSDTRTITVPPTAEFDDPFSPSICPPPASFSCLAVNQNVSIDGIINSDGTMTATEIEFLDPAPLTEELEGVIITPIANNQFQMVAINGMGSGSGDVTVGTLVTVNLNNASTYIVDPKNLGISIIISPLGFQSSADLVMGQTVMLKGGTVDFTNNSYSNYTRTLLRYSSIGGTVQSPGGAIFTLSGVSPFLVNLVSNSVVVNTFPNTAYDNISNFSGLVGGTTNASVRGLYLNPNSGAAQPLLAAKVRAH